MILFQRKYDSWKLFGGKKRTAELERLSEDSANDFEFRRLYIEENEKWLHILFSRQRVSQLLSFSFMALAFFYIQLREISLVLFIISFIFFIFSLIFKRQFKVRASKYDFGLNLVDLVIADTYGISLR